MAQNEFSVAIAHAVPGAEQVEHLIDALPDLGGEAGHPVPDVGDMGKDSQAVQQLAEQLQHGQDQIAATIAQSGANWDAATAMLDHQDPGVAAGHGMDAFAPHDMPGSDC